MIRRVSVVAPAFNEQESIRQFLDKTVKALQNNNLKGEILVVNDGSTDKTAEILQDYAKKHNILRVITNRKNEGLTTAAWKGFKQAKEGIIIFLPADLESDPEEDIPLLLKPLEEGYDVSVGWRYGGRIRVVKKVTSFIFNSLARLIFNIPLHDLTWIKAFKKDAINDIELRSEWHRYLAVFLRDKGYKIKEIRTRFYPRKLGKSKFGRFGLMRLPSGFFDMISIKFLQSFPKRPMFVFGSLGMILLLLGVIGGLYLTYVKITTGVLSPRMPLIFLVVLLILSGIQLFALGFLAEFLVTINDSIKKRK